MDVASAHSGDKLQNYAFGFLGYGFMGDTLKSSERYRWMGPARYDWSGKLHPTTPVLGIHHTQYKQFKFHYMFTVQKQGLYFYCAGSIMKAVITHAGKLQHFFSDRASIIYAL